MWPRTEVTGVESSVWTEKGRTQNILFKEGRKAVLIMAEHGRVFREGFQGEQFVRSRDEVWREEQKAQARETPRKTLKTCGHFCCRKHTCRCHKHFAKMGFANSPLSSFPESIQPVSTSVRYRFRVACLQTAPTRHLQTVTSKTQLLISSSQNPLSSTPINGQLHSSSCLGFLIF